MASSQQCLEEYLPKVSELKHSDPIDLCGDGRAENPGHNAKYGTYTLIEESTGKMIDFQLVQVTEVTSSIAMGAEECKRSLNFLIDQEFQSDVYLQIDIQQYLPTRKRYMQQTNTSLIHGIWQSQ